MQDTNKNMTWQKPRIVVDGNPPLQAFMNNVTELIGQKLSTDLPTPTAIAKGVIHPKILTMDKLLFLLLNYPQTQVRNHLKKWMKMTLQFTNQHLPPGINCGPVFYPEILGTTGTSEEEYLVRNEDVESILKLSEAVLLYNSYTNDQDFLTSDNFNMLLRVSRFWASFLNNKKISTHWLKEKGSLEYLEKTATDTMQFTLDFMGYLKAESSWLYEDLREQNKFSEIKETTCWKKIIRKESLGKGKIYEISSIPDIKIKLVKKEDFSDYMYNLSEQYAAEKKELIMDEDTLSSIWLNIVYCCYGLTISDNKLKLLPSLPAGWTLCKLVIHNRNSMFELETTTENFKVTNLSTHPVDIIVLNERIRVPGLSEEILNI